MMVSSARAASTSSQDWKRAASVKSTGTPSSSIRIAGLFDHMPPHTPRHAVIEAAEMTREAGADLIVTVGGGSITDGAKAVQAPTRESTRQGIERG